MNFNISFSNMIFKYYFLIIHNHLSKYKHDEQFVIQMKLMKQGLLKRNANLINLPLLTEIVTILENVFAIKTEEAIEVMTSYLEHFYS